MAESEAQKNNKETKASQSNSICDVSNTPKATGSIPHQLEAASEQ